MSLKSISEKKVCPKNESIKNDHDLNQKVEQLGDFNGKVVTVTTQKVGTPLHPDFISETAKNVGFSPKLMPVSRPYSKACIQTPSVALIPQKEAILAKIVQNLTQPYRDLPCLEYLCKELKIFIQNPEDFKAFLDNFIINIFYGECLKKQPSEKEWEILITCIDGEDATPAVEKVFSDFFTALVEKLTSCWKKNEGSYSINVAQDYFFDILLRRIFQKEKTKLEKFVMIVGIENFYALFSVLISDVIKDLKKKGSITDQIVEISFEMLASQFPFLDAYNHNHEARLEGLINLLGKRELPLESLDKIFYTLLFADKHCTSDKNIFEDILNNYKNSTISARNIVLYTIKEMHLLGMRAFRERHLFGSYFKNAKLTPEQRLAIQHECDQEPYIYSKIFFPLLKG